jgi:hypothetical protein
VALLSAEATKGQTRVAIERFHSRHGSGLHAHDLLLLLSDAPGTFSVAVQYHHMSSHSNADVRQHSAARFCEAQASDCLADQVAAQPKVDIMMIEPDAFRRLRTETKLA